jgi:hypothetical protein
LLQEPAHLGYLGQQNPYEEELDEQEELDGQEELDELEELEELGQHLDFFPIILYIKIIIIFIFYWVLKNKYIEIIIYSKNHYTIITN